MKTIAEIKTYDNDAASRGYKLEIRDDGKTRITRRSCWQGSVNNRVWLIDTPSEIMAALDGGEDDPDLETAVHEWLADADHDDWRMIRRGYVVR